MKIVLYPRLAAFLLVLFSFNICQAQLSTDEKKLLKTADHLFNEEKFSEALPIYLQLDAQVKNVQIIYHIGACYLNTAYDKMKAIPYLEYVSRSNELDVPIAVHKDLGDIYHYTYRFEEAIKQYRLYLNKATEDSYVTDRDLSEVNRMISICQHAIKLTGEPFKADISILPYPVNSLESEFCPMISADEQKLFFMRTIGIGKTDQLQTKILLTKKQSNGLWGNPRELHIRKNEKIPNLPIRLAGISPDGNTIYLSIGTNLSVDIYEGKLADDTLIYAIKKLNEHINSPYYEGRVSISADGTEMYFVSDRPGGFGRTDIYKTSRTKKGDWGEAVNLGSRINTVYNEDSPFMHPDNMTLLFSSEGHETMGGNDIFKSILKDGHWSEPENMVFTNSTKDDLYFVLNANGQVGYFSSSKNNVYDKHNIFKVNLKDPIPLTLVKGTITSGSPEKPIAADISVYDKETKEAVKYVYNPDPNTGSYLMIFPPAKNYDIIIKADGFMPQIINVHIPYQTYFYELYQKIHLNQIFVNKMPVGEEVTVDNMFYDLYRTPYADSLMHDVPKNASYYDHLLELVENIIQTTDTMQINYADVPVESPQKEQATDHLLALIEDAIETTDTVTLSIIDANARQKEKVSNKHFYGLQNLQDSAHLTIYGKDTIYSAPPVSTIQEDKVFHYPEGINTDDGINKQQFRLSDPDHRLYVHKTELFYDANAYALNDKSLNNLQDLLRLLINNPSLGIEIYGYADGQGTTEDNLLLSKKRAQEVMLYFVEQNIQKYRIITMGFGEKNALNREDQSFRKVEINVFKLNP